MCSHPVEAALNANDLGKEVRIICCGTQSRLCASAHNLEGKFSSEGLAALAGEDTSVELALARSLVNRMDEGDARRAWKKVIGSPSPQPALAPPPTPSEEPEPVPAANLAGEELVSLMRRGKLTIPVLAERLGVSQNQVRKARKQGVPGTDKQRWLDAIGEVPDTVPIKRRSRVRSALQAVGVAAMWLLAVLLGSPHSG